MTHPAIFETVQAFHETTLIADPEQIVAFCTYLRDAEQFNRISSITAVDWHPAEPRFEVVYHLHSTGANKRLRIKCRLHSNNAEIDSVTSVWRGANWYERETFDMFGITFRNHPNLVRILMPVDWDGHPLRKDYPVHGYKYGYSNE